MDKQKTQGLEVDVRIGKSGVTNNLLAEIKNHLKKKKIIKVKFLKSYIQGKDKKQEAKTISQLTNTKLVKQIGFVVVLSKS